MPKDDEMERLVKEEESTWRAHQNAVEALLEHPRATDVRDYLASLHESRAAKVASVTAYKKSAKARRWLIDCPEPVTISRPTNIGGE